MYRHAHHEENKNININILNNRHTFCIKKDISETFNRKENFHDQKFIVRFLHVITAYFIRYGRSRYF